MAGILPRLVRPQECGQCVAPVEHPGFQREDDEQGQYAGRNLAGETRFATRELDWAKQGNVERRRGSSPPIKVIAVDPARMARGIGRMVRTRIAALYPAKLPLTIL